MKNLLSRFPLIFIIVGLVLAVFSSATLLASVEPPTAEASYSVVKEGNIYRYTFTVKNTSASPNDSIYSLLVGIGYNQPYVAPLPLQNAALVSAPAGWTGTLAGGASYQGNTISYGTNWKGTVEASGYIKPGQTATFIFTATNQPPAELRFGVDYYNGAGWGGQPFNGLAKLTATKPTPSIKKIKKLTPIKK